jgi:hypothetical protein
MITNKHGQLVPSKGVATETYDEMVESFYATAAEHHKVSIRKFKTDPKFAKLREETDELINITWGKTPRDQAKVRSMEQDAWEYTMLPQEQQVTATMARNLINQKYPGLKLGDYTDEHVRYLMDKIYKTKIRNVNGKEVTQYINRNPRGGGYDNYHRIYSYIRESNGTKALVPGTSEWMNFMKQHLNKAFGIGGVGTTGIMTTELE